MGAKGIDDLFSTPCKREKKVTGYCGYRPSKPFNNQRPTYPQFSFPLKQGLGIRVLTIEETCYSPGIRVLTIEETCYSPNIDNKRER